MPSTVGLADLHRHLDGSLRRDTLAELAGQLGLILPDDLAFSPGMGLPAALRRFEFTLSLLQTPASVRRVAAEICQDAAREGVTTLEIRFAPQLHRGAVAEAIVEAALEGISGRAGLILCGLYGEDPKRLYAHVDIASRYRGVVGIDLAGGPDASHRNGLRDYAEAFLRAAERGIGRTVHAGEGRSPDEIRQAIEVLRAERIGHGTSVLEDDAVVDLVVQRQVAIEACLTSNVHTGVLRNAIEHPIARWLDRGIMVAVCTDNTLLSATDAPAEHDLAGRAVGMTPEKLQRAISHGHAAAFRR